MGIFYDAGKVAAARSANGVAEPNWGRIIGALVIAGFIFGSALYFEDSGNPEVSKTLLRVFEVTFTALLALLGIETAKS
jgi:hypothetical protein